MRSDQKRTVLTVTQAYVNNAHEFPTTKQFFTVITGGSLPLPQSPLGSLHHFHGIVYMGYIA